MFNYTPPKRFPMPWGMSPMSREAMSFIGPRTKQKHVDAAEVWKGRPTPVASPQYTSPGRESDDMAPEFMSMGMRLSSPQPYAGSAGGAQGAATAAPTQEPSLGSPLGRFRMAPRKSQSHWGKRGLSGFFAGKYANRMGVA